MKVTRRTFVKSVGAGTAALAIGGSSAVEGALTALAADTETLVPGYCRGTIGCMCYCGRYAHVKNGRVVDITGMKDHHYTHGTLCAKGIAEIGNTYSPHRILHPLKRVDGKFVQISWDQAITEISTKLKDIRSAWDGKPLHHMTASQMRALARTATPRNSSGDQEWVNYMRMGELFKSSPHYSGCLGCYGNWWRSELATTGFPYPHNQMETFKYAKLCLNFGTNIAEAFPSMMQHYYDAVEAGMEMVSVEPRMSKMSAKAKSYVPIRPATDGALVLGIIKQLVDNGWLYPHLSDYVVQSEWDAFVANSVMEWTPEKVEQTTWVPAATVVELAQKVHAAGRDVSVLWGSRLSTSTNGFGTSRIMTMLLFAVGAFGVKGGGIHQPKPAGVPSLYTPLASSTQQKWPDKGQPDDPYSWGAGWVPEEQWPDEPYISDAKAGFFLGGNGITRASGDQRKYLKRLQDLGTMVYASIEWSEMADLANYVLPMATDLETGGSSSLCGSNHSLQWKDPAVAPLGEAKSDMWILNEVFKRVFGDETYYRECPDCEAQANGIIATRIAAGDTMDQALDAAWVALIKPTADAVKAEWEIERFKMSGTGKDLMTIINEHAAVSHAATGHDHGHLYVMRNWELLFREDLKAYGDSIGVDLDNHGRAWVTNIINQGPDAVYPYWWKFHMLAWPVMPGTPAAVDPDNWHPYSGLRIDHVKSLPGGVYWPMPWGLNVNADMPGGGKNPNYDPAVVYHGETVFFEKCTQCWMTAEQLGKGPIPLLMTPPVRWNGTGFEPWESGKAAIDLKGQTWYGAHLPEWHEPTYFGGDELARKDAAFIESEDFPFITITGKTPQLLNAQTKGGNELLVEICEVPRVWINPATATTLGIADDDTVQITTPKSVEFGPLHMKAKVTELIAPRVAFLAHGSGNVAIDGKLKNEGGENFLGNTDQDHYTHMVGYSHGRAKIVKV